MFSWHYREGNKGKGRKWFPSRSSVHYICCTCMVVYRVAVYVHAGTTNDECICVVYVLNLLGFIYLFITFCSICLFISLLLVLQTGMPMSY